MFEEERRLRAQFAPGDEAGDREARRMRVGGLAFDRGSLADVVDRIEYVAGVAGIDGVDVLPEGLEEVSLLPAITAGLLARGWLALEIRKVLGENAVAP